MQEASSLLPMVRVQLDELQQLKRQFEAKYMELRDLKLSHGNRGQSQENDPYFALECELEFIQMQFQTGVANLERKGIELKDVDHGLVDFPALIRGEEVLLCWKQGEPDIAHYHGLYDGFAGRKPITGEEW
nr:DUF2203 domain-containing protein [Paenibacillus hamazuiensis]